MSARLRVGAVSYLNTKPLVFGLERAAPEMQLVFDLPSRLADGLAAGHYDVALIPSVEYFQDPTYQIVSDACIACRGPVWSVKLLSRVPIDRIGSLALDEGSRTSAALVRILLKQRYGVEPALHPLPIGETAESTSTDAVLLIGDRAMHPPKRDFIDSWDLGDEWCRWSGLPFVFAMWVAREDVNVDRVSSLLAQARDEGVKRVAEIAAEQAPKYRLTTDACLAYLRDNLHFFLGSREREGMELYRRHVSTLGLISKSAVATCGR